MYELKIVRFISSFKDNRRSFDCVWPRCGQTVLRMTWVVDAIFEDTKLELSCPLDDGADGDSGGAFGDPGLSGFYPGYSGDVEVDPWRVFCEDV